MNDVVSVVLPAERPQQERVVAIVAAAPAHRERQALRLFATRAGLLHSLVAAEVLGRPVALREDNLLRETGV